MYDLCASLFPCLCTFATWARTHASTHQVFSYFVDVMVVEYVGQPDRFKLLPKGGAKAGDGSSVTGPSNMIICMEYCDAGKGDAAIGTHVLKKASTRVLQLGSGAQPWRNSGCEGSFLPAVLPACVLVVTSMVNTGRTMPAPFSAFPYPFCVPVNTHTPQGA